jgi:flagellin
MSFTFRDFEMDQGTTAGVKGVHTLATTAATFSGYGATDEMHITNSAGDTVIVDVDAMVVAGGSSHNFTNITFTELVAAINTQIDAADDASGFEGMVATDVGSAGTSIAFTQDTAGTGDVLSIKRVTSAGVMTDFGTLTTTTVGSAAGGDGNPMAANIAKFQTAGSQAQATDTISELDAAITGVDKMRADFGAVINRLEYTVDNLNSIAQNTRAARSAVMDADYAAETTELARTQIIAQASTAMLSQANQQAQSVLALLK